MFEIDSKERNEPMPELRCCPRCEAKAEWSEQSWDDWIILCTDCGNYNTTEYFDIDELTKWWNDRPYIDRLLKEIEFYKRLAEGEPAYMLGFDND